MSSPEPTTAVEIPDLLNPDSYPRRDELTETCDLVMKGGITSGVIYPHTVCELATSRRLVQVGGTSAGAIAAGGAAAAEYGRDTHSSASGFPQLASLPSQLAEQTADGHTRLFHLFQAQAETRTLYRLVSVLIGRGTGRSKFGRALIPALLTLRPLPVILVLAVGLAGLLAPAILLARAIADRSGGGTVVAAVLLLVGLIVFLLGTLAAVLASVVMRLSRDVPKNGYGMCSGMSGPGSSHPPLTEWLADKFDQIAGKPAADGPLTFGDLTSRGITLAMLTTDLSAGTQNRLPFRTRVWAFDPQEFGRLFPPRIVQWMTEHAAVPESDDDRRVFARFRATGLCPLPTADALPIIVAVRMSLSFPILLSAVPLYAVDYTQDGHPIVAHRFSDGGITSNFPIHFFDAAIPGRPTFGIDLVKVGSLNANPAQNVSMPVSNRDGILARTRTIGTLSDFVGALANTIQNWSDSMQARVPGYRDRIVAVHHTKQEGGLNLDMESSTVALLAERGRLAGQRADNFDFENHRWVRLRSMFQTLEDFIEPAAVQINAPSSSDLKSYREMMSDPPSYKSPTLENAGPIVADAITGLAAAYESTKDRPESRFREGAPKPRPALRVRPQP
ncbi:patatin-like phospholipase family protein [Mycolicibacterium tusciae]|uniref:patatin-like phospholipase family protein n=1 Tax=Mycolicibacterium tusciae TaxID=75922 RepID=UPI00024A2AB0|nr:patatin-like phospholipase family protein [Mycolicibacterium tusciae]